MGAAYANDYEYETNSAKGYTGIKRKDKRSLYGTYYDSTPILYELPEIGRTIKVTEQRYDHEGRATQLKVLNGRELQVCLYTQGIDNPLKSNNFLVCSYVTRSGVTLSCSFRTLDIVLGIMVIERVANEKNNATEYPKKSVKEEGHIISDTSR